MVRTAACFQNSSPESPNITITKNMLYMDGGYLHWENELVSFADLESDTYEGASVLSFTLLKYPQASGAVHVSFNSGGQRYGVDFAVRDNKVYFLHAFGASDSATIHYMAYDGTQDPGAWPVGFINAYNDASTPPTGWLLCDGSTAHLQSQYPSLYSFCSTHDLIAAETSGLGATFTIKQLLSSMQSGTELVTLYAVIKT